MMKTLIWVVVAALVAGCEKPPPRKRAQQMFDEARAHAEAQPETREMHLRVARAKVEYQKRHVEILRESLRAADSVGEVGLLQVDYAAALRTLEEDRRELARLESGD